jgi:hypothetical protein
VKFHLRVDDLTASNDAENEIVELIIGAEKETPLVHARDDVHRRAAIEHTRVMPASELARM